MTRTSTTRGFERASNYVRCALDTPEKQRECELYACGGSGYCVHNANGRDDSCRSEEAKERLRKDGRK